MRNCTSVWPIAVLGMAVLMGGCTREPQLFSAGKPIVLQRRPAITLRSKPDPVATRPAEATPAAAEAQAASARATLSADEKQRLFQRFQETQSRTAETATTRTANP